MSPHNPSVSTATPEFLADGGEVGAVARAYDWSSHPLGVPEAWPRPLKAAISLMLSTAHPMCLSWGKDLIFFYNDAYSSILGRRHPESFGQPSARVWADIWSDIEPLIDQVLKGQAIRREDLHVRISRDGREQDTWWTFSYSPLRDEDGSVRGFVNICNDTTAKVRNERRLTAEREALRDSEARFRALVNASSDVVYQMSADWTEMRQLDGRNFLADTERPSVQWLDEYLFPEDRPQVMAVIAAAIRSRSTFELEHRVRRVDGTAGWTFSRAVPVFGADGTIVEWFGMASDVTERKRTEQRLVDSEREIRFALKAGRFGTWSLDLVTGELTTSETCRINFGRSPDALFTYEQLRDSVHPDDRARMADAIEHSIAAHQDYDIDYRVVTPSGDIRWVSVRGQPNRTEDGTPLGMAGVSLDITDRKHTEEQLADTRSRYRELFEAVDAGFCVLELKFDEDGRAIDYRHVEINPAFEHQTGLKDKVGIWMSEALPGLERHWFDTYGEVVRTGRAVRFENRADLLDRWFDVHAFRTGAPEDQRVAVLFNDITERKRADDRLRTLNETLEAEVADRTVELRRFRDIVEATASPICAFDTEYRLIAFNKAHNDEFRRVNGFDTKLGDVFPDLFIPAQQPVMRALMSRALSGERFKVEQRFGRPELGQPVWEIVYTPLLGENDTVIGAFHLATDISDRLRAEADLQTAQEALRQSQKMEAVGQLTGGLAHDFNNLLAGISGSLEIMHGRMQQGRFNDVERFMTVAQGAAKRAAALTHRLLAFSRRQTLDPRSTDVSRLVSGMLEMIQRTVGPAIAVDVVNSPDLWSALVDPSQLENSLLNLCLNARDAMPGGGRITVEIANRQLDENAALRQDMPKGQYLSMCVTDTGTGMPPEVVARVFEPFFTTKPIGEGTGLGLSMIYGFAKQSGGQVRIHSTVGIGTTVCIYLPRHHGAVDAEASVAPVNAVPYGARGATVLIVDDEPSVRMLLVDILEELGYTALQAGDSNAGLRILQSDVPIDLLVTDVGLPGGMNGRQMADAARDHRPQLKILFVTGYAESAVFGNGHLKPGMAVLTKPFSIDTMAARIRLLVEAE